MKKFCWLIVAAVLTTVGAAMLMSGNVSAAVDTSKIYVTPVEVNLDLTPGEVYKGRFEVVNNGDEAFDFSLTANRFYVKDLTYETTFDGKSAFTLIADWVTFDQTDYRGLKPGNRQEVKYRINVPKDAPSGGQYAVLFAVVSSNATDEGSGVAVDIRVGMKIYAKVSGKTRLGGEVTSVKQGKFYRTPPISAVALVKNTGNVDFYSKHEYIVKSLSGRELFKDSKFVRVMPNTTRQVELKWSKTPWLGIFRVRNTVSFLDKTKYDREEIVIVAPIWFVIVLLIIIGLIVLLIIRIVKKTWKIYQRRKRTKSLQNQGSISLWRVKIKNFKKRLDKKLKRNV